MQEPQMFLVYVAPNMYNMELEDCKKKEQIHKDTG